MFGTDADVKGGEIDALESIRKGYVETVWRLTLAAEYRDPQTGSHIKRTSLSSQILSRLIGLVEKEVDAIFLASPMHDVGKIGIPDTILLKAGGLTEEERRVMRNHTLIGGEILRDPHYEVLKVARDIALTHHESWDGSGYPHGMRGTEIPLPGRIVHIVDVYDAIRSRRPYKKEYSHEMALEEMEREKERFDPEIYRAFARSSHAFDRLFEENRA